MISAIELLKSHPELSNGKKLTESDFFLEFEYTFGSRTIKFTWDLYQECFNNLSYNGMSLYTLTKEDLTKNIHESGMNVYEFLVLVYHECGINPYFFASEIIRMPTFERDYTRFTLDIGKVAQIAAFMKGFHSVLCNPRQTGSSSLLAVLYNWLEMFRTNCSNILLPVRSTGDYLLFMDKIAAIKEGIPKMFFEPYITSTFMYEHDVCTNYVFVNDFEFLEEPQYQFMLRTNQIRFKPSIGIFFGHIGFRTKLQLVGNTVINRYPSENLYKYVEEMTIRFDEKYCINPEKCFENPVNIYGTPFPNPIEGNDRQNYILTIKYDEHHICKQEALDHLKEILPPELYDSEVRRIHVDHAYESDDRK